MAHFEPQQKMHSAAQMSDRLKTASDITAVDRESAWRVEIRKDSELVFEVTIPKTVLEWFVCAKKEDRKVWSDWTEHYSMTG